MKERQFIDEAWINIESGSGGDGLATFHKEKGISRGGPSGGNGGDGGNVYFRGDAGENTLLNFRSKINYKAKKGGPGGSNNKTGSTGENIYIEVPIGTQIFDEKGSLLADIISDRQEVLILKGGKGGRGNTSFKSSKNHSPMLYEAGELGIKLRVKLNLKVLADVGLLGFPNAGKSTFISVVTNAKPKIGDYPFTTITPKLGIVKQSDYSFIISDLPGLIEGAYLNKGMGIQFLKHLERTRIILHLIDVSESDYYQKYQILRNELKQYSEKLAQRKEFIVLTKIDLLENKNQCEQLAKKWKEKVFCISSLTRTNLEKLLIQIANYLKENPKEQDQIDENQVLFEYKKEDNNDLSFRIEQRFEHEWWIIGKYPQYWGNRIPMTNTENFWRLYKKLESKGIIQALLDAGMQEGDYIHIENSSFELQYYDN